jgi:small subunit ribosomal protein S20
MAITSSAKKAIRSSARKRVMNIRRKRTLHDAVLDARKLAGKKKDETMAALSAAYQAIDKALKRGIIKKNTAARKKSRLAQLLKKASMK